MRMMEEQIYIREGKAKNEERKIKDRGKEEK